MKQSCTYLVALMIASIFLKVTNASIEYDAQFQDWMRQFNKRYSRSSELETRRSIWIESHIKIQQHNKEADEGKHTYRLGHNEFSDLKYEEFAERYLIKLSLNPSKRQFEKTRVKEGIVSKRLTLPTSVDYRNTGHVNPVVDQGACGCCWAFAATGTIEGAYFRATNRTAIFSPQQLVDCDVGNNNQGCNGGMPERAFEYIKKNGLSLDSHYPYTASSGSTCKYSLKHVTLNGWSYTSNTSWRDEVALARAIAQVGPIAIALYTTNTFQLYSSGIYYDPNCSPYKWSSVGLYPDINHAVVGVGYGTDVSTGRDYFILKNQYGTSWGMSGYMLIERNRNNTCNIASWASYPIGVRFENSTVPYQFVALKSVSSLVLPTLSYPLFIYNFILFHSFI